LSADVFYGIFVVSLTCTTEYGGAKQTVKR